MDSSSPRLRIILAGAGRVAAHLAAALHEQGHTLVLVVNRTEERAGALAARSGASFSGLPVARPLPPADVVIYAVSDSALEEMITAVPPGEMLALHTAGSMPVEIFRGKAENYGVLYPLQTFTEDRETDFRQVPLCIEANTPGNEEKLRALALTLSRRVIRASSQQRLTLHLAAVWVNNFVNHLYAVAEDLLQEEELSFDLLRPLIEETAAKATALGPRKAQTGPAVRNDENVIKKHLELLSCSPELQHLYRLLTDSIRQKTGSEKE
jgi:predicted short-subunit dehydrogenase-like oxidoreductase (DUF2520 family)